MRKPMRMLSPLVAKRIAAGEVIEKPHSIVRELMDNAADAGSTQIDVHLEQGGIESIRVLDNGHGMSLEDLSLCCESHATSKISCIEDLDRLNSLGFRGEALSSIAACAEMTIVSGTEDGDHHILKSNSSGSSIRPGGNTRGSTVEVQRLFYEIPGRKKFLKSPQAEGNACRKVFLDKSLPFPDIQFRLFMNKEMKLFFPPSTQFERVIQAYGHLADSSGMGTLEYQSGPVSIQAVLSKPQMYRSDRNYIQIFVNKRRIDEYSLVQAVSHGYSAVLPGGAFPYCFLFITISPDMVDFNIHPAKREVRFWNQREIHHQVTTAVRQFLGTHREPEVFSKGFGPEARQELFTAEPSAAPAYRKHPSQWYQDLSSIKETVQEFSSHALVTDFQYLGQVFDLFLVVQREDAVFLIDQHAAHERIIFDEISSNPAGQPLLFPISFTAEHDIQEFLTAHKQLYDQVGIHMSNPQGSTWEITSIPAVCKGIENELTALIAESAGDPEDIRKKLYAMVACKAAVKDGEILDPLSAKELVKKAFALPTPRCPHGRPIWKKITREDLFRDVHRILSGTQDRKNR